MPNTILTPTAVTREALRILHQKLNFVGNVNRSYDDSFAKTGAKIGDSLKIRLPNEYTVLAFDAWQSGWMMGADADAEATFDHAGRFGVEQPFVMMSSTALSAEARDRVSLQTLRESATFDGTDPSRDDGAHRLTLYERYLDDRGYEGQVIRFDTVVDGRSSTTVLAAFLSPDRSAVYSVNVSCSTQCYLRSADEIDAIVDSIELTP